MRELLIFHSTYTHDIRINVQAIKLNKLTHVIIIALYAPVIDSLNKFAHKPCEFTVNVHVYFHVLTPTTFFSLQPALKMLFLLWTSQEA